MTDTSSVYTAAGGVGRAASVTTFPEVANCNAGCCSRRTTRVFQTAGQEDDLAFGVA